MQIEATFIIPVWSQEDCELAWLTTDRSLTPLIAPNLSHPKNDKKHEPTVITVGTVGYYCEYCDDKFVPVSFADEYYV